jgi:hypothetical protein
MPSATTSWQHSLARPSERTPSRGLLERDSERGDSSVPGSEQTWAAGDRRTQALGLALKRQLSGPTLAAQQQKGDAGIEDGGSLSAGGARSGADGSGRGGGAKVSAEFDEEVLPRCLP